MKSAVGSRDQGGTNDWDQLDGNNFTAQDRLDVHRSIKNNILSFPWEFQMSLWVFRGYIPTCTLSSKMYTYIYAGTSLHLGAFMGVWLLQDSSGWAGEVNNARSAAAARSKRDWFMAANKRQRALWIVGTTAAWVFFFATRCVWKVYFQ